MAETYLRGNTWYARHHDANGEPTRTSLGVKRGQEGETALVQAALARLLTGAAAGPKASRMTLDEAYRKADREHWASTADRRNVAGRYAQVSAFLGKDTPIASLTGSKLGEMKAHFLEQGNDSKTVNKKLAVISKILHLAADEWEVLDRVPVIKRFKEKRGRVRWLSDTEEATALAYIAAGTGGAQQAGGYGGGNLDVRVPREGSSDFADLVPVLIDTGLRLSEALRIVDRDVTYGAEPCVYVPESKAGAHRSVPLTNRAVIILARRQRRDAKAHALQHGTSQPFGNLTVDRCGELWELTRKAMGLVLDEEFVIHALRHTFAVRMVEGEVDIRVVSYLMGHKRLETTMIYAHVSNKAARNAVRQVERVRAAVPEVTPALSVVGGTGTKS